MRIDDATEERVRTELVECDPETLEAIHQLGRESFREREDDIWGLPDGGG